MPKSKKTPKKAAKRSRSSSKDPPPRTADLSIALKAALVGFLLAHDDPVPKRRESDPYPGAKAIVAHAKESICGVDDPSWLANRLANIAVYTLHT
eukprot:gene335-biopygen320